METEQQDTAESTTTERKNNQELKSEGEVVTQDKKLASDRESHDRNSEDRDRHTSNSTAGTDVDSPADCPIADGGRAVLPGMPQRGSDDPLAAEDVVSCICGATSDDDSGREFVECERCLVWQHSDCAGFDASQHSSFVCIKCLLEQPLPAKATLIISPQSIVQQWLEEIWKHTDQNSLSVMHYRGVKESFISPYHLASSDVVLVTYETLHSELNHARSHEVSRVLRHRKRYNAAPSPLPALHWWRVCLDEAQMVETATTKAAEMCHKLSSVHRWCVTGTPIQRDLSDLYGLVLFLDLDPYSQSLWYRRLISGPYLRGQEEAMVDLFSSIMWRSSKEDVAEELQLPSCTEKIHWLTFSLVEAYFYKKQQQMCVTEAAKVLSKVNVGSTLNSLCHSTVQKLMTPLHSLRHACCHPQMVRRGGYLPISNSKSLTMPQLLDKLIKQAKSEAREALRKLILSYNGLAGLYILKEEWRLACETYREAIATWREYREKEVECDRLQRIHTLENLAWLVEGGHTGGVHSLEDDSLGERASELREQYMSKAEGQVKAALEALTSCGGTIQELDREANWQLCDHLGQLPSSAQSLLGQDGAGQHGDAVEEREEQEEEEEEKEEEERDVKEDEGTEQGAQPAPKPLRPIVIPSVPWCLAATGWVQQKGEGRQLVNTVNIDLREDHDPQHGLFHLHSTHFRDLSGLEFMMCSHMDVANTNRQSLLSTLQGLVATPTDDQIAEAVLCHLTFTRVGGEEREECELCRVEGAMVDYGKKLFSGYNDSQRYHSQDHGEGSRGVHIFERITRSMLNFLRHKRAPRKLLKSGKAFLTYFEAVKKEYDAMRTLWQMLSQRLSASDELRLASTRMRYMTPYEMVVGTNEASAVHVLGWDIKWEQFESDKALARIELTRSLGQVLYLQNLAKAQEQDSENLGSCPVCTRQLGQEVPEWGLLPCGHSLCMDCLLEIARRRQHTPYGFREVVRLPCPLCRSVCLSSEVNYVRPGEVEDVSVKGSPSTKILGVTRTLLTIQRESPGAKSLVFSSWMETLALIAVSLKENEVKYSFLKTAKTFQSNLTEFKKSDDVNVLLLPLHSGSKGLNIIEATHVVLVEPSLNISAELQAIGRVHRMGQTKPITVHRFFISNSVEERIHQLLNSSQDRTKFFIQKETESTLTVNELEGLFQ